MTDAPQAAGPDFSQGIPMAELPRAGIVAGHVSGEPVLLSRYDGRLFAVGGSCTHYGAPLAEGLVVGDTIRCPWHHACFSLRTGAALKAPAFDALQRWQVEVDRDVVYVRARAVDSIGEQRRPSHLVERIVIVGGGAAGFAAAEMLRRLGYCGGLTMLSEDESPPCDRPNLSKDYLAGTAPEEWIPLKGADFYREQNIDLRLGSRVAAIDVQHRTVITEGGERFGYDALLLATGAEPVRLSTPGFNLGNVHTLRSLADARSIIADAKGASTAAVIGASFIGMEAAAALVARNLKVHVVAPGRVPMEKILGAEIGGFVRDLHESRGVVFHPGRTAAGYDGATLVLDDGSAIAADLVVVGVGVSPRTVIAQSAGLATGNGIIVDQYLESSVPGIYAAGDVANFPLDASGRRARIEHWVVAQRQGQIAARNMLGELVPFTEVPFFWSRHYDTSILYVGHARRPGRITVDGSPALGDCTVRFFENDALTASASIGRALENLREELYLERETGGIPA